MLLAHTLLVLAYTTYMQAGVTNACCSTSRCRGGNDGVVVVMVEEGGGIAAISMYG